MSNAIAKVLKFVGGIPSSKLNCPPNNCIPSRAKIRMNKNRRNSNEIIDLIEFRREITRFLNEDQYLVTLKILKSLNALKTENPKDPSLTALQITSKIEPAITTQSNRLKAD